MAPFNLGSPTCIKSPCDLEDMRGWVEHELDQISSRAIRTVVATVCDNMSDFIQFSSQAILLWNGCDRITPKGKRQKYHKYPDEIRQRAKEAGVTLDSRPNGPAIAAFLLAGGRRPNRIGSSNAWSVHHLYSGKYPYLNRDSTTHASKHGLHFSQSAGVVAAQPIADAICDEFPFFSWLLRAEAFRLFGYDPDGVFSTEQDDFGFVPDRSCEVIFGKKP